MEIKKGSRGRLYLKLRSEHETVEGKIKFPWSLSELFIKYMHAGMTSVKIEYIPYITTSEHGTFTIEIHDNRKFFDNDKVRVKMICPTGKKIQAEFTGFDWADRNEESPYEVIVRSDLINMNEDKTIGIIIISPRFTYSNNEPPHVTTRAKSIKLSKTKNEENKTTVKRIGGENSGILCDMTAPEVIIHRK